MVGDGDDRNLGGGIVLVPGRVQVLPCCRQCRVGVLGTLRDAALTVEEVDATGGAVLRVAEAAAVPALLRALLTGQLGKPSAERGRGCEETSVRAALDTCSFERRAKVRRQECGTC